MSEKQVCPWCQNEIIWEGEPGTECPYCFNDLTDYRTLVVDLDREDEGVQDFYTYEEKVRQYLERQEPVQTLECEQCQERMVIAGELEWNRSSFHPNLIPGMPPFLEGPVRVQVHVCPSCFQTKMVLAEDIRLRIIQKLQEK